MSAAGNGVFLQLGRLRFGAAQIHQFPAVIHDAAVNGDAAGFFGEVEVLRFFDQMAVGNFAVGQLDFVVNPFVVVFIHLMHRNVSASRMVQAWKNLNLPNWRTLHAAQASSVVMAESASSSVLMVPSVTLSQPCGQVPGLRADAQQNVGGKKSAEEHHFGRQKQPDAELGVVNAGVRPVFNCVGDFHEKSVMRGWGLTGAAELSGSSCGVKSVAWPGALYS